MTVEVIEGLHTYITYNVDTRMYEAKVKGIDQIVTAFTKEELKTRTAYFITDWYDGNGSPPA